MNGIEFYDYLRKTYLIEGQLLYGNFTFYQWLLIPIDRTYSFQFALKNENRKSIRKIIIIKAWDANQRITDNWLIENFGTHYHNDCRLRILNFLIQSNANLR